MHLIFTSRRTEAVFVLEEMVTSAFRRFGVQDVRQVLCSRQIGLLLCCIIFPSIASICNRNKHIPFLSKFTKQYKQGLFSRFSAGMTQLNPKSETNIFQISIATEQCSRDDCWFLYIVCTSKHLLTM